MNEHDDKINILLVDDRPGSLMALESALADLGQNLVKASSGLEALKYILKMEFAVILLDVHMPGMDGFETAELIRQRHNSRHTPIIFITGYTDELHISKGYSLGAVDYILAPVTPEVLRAKVEVFVELFKKNRQVARRADQLQKLAAASVQINSAPSIERTLQTITEAARDVVGAHQSITLFLGDPSVGLAEPVAVSSFSEKYRSWQGRELDITPVTQTEVARGPTATRMTEVELRAHPDWEIVSELDIPPVCGGMLAAPFTGHDGQNLGVIYLADAYDQEFTDEDESILAQLAQIASTATENLLYSKAREANRLKDEFLATLSHELRTPLNAMLGWTRLLREEEPDPEMLAQGLQVIERNVNAQSRLIEDLLDISRITNGKIRLEVNPMSMKTAVETAVDAIQPSADAKQIALELKVADAAGVILGDAGRLQQVMWNLLSNAVKFTPAGGSVQAGVEQQGEHVRVWIRDTGEGIPEELLPHVFDRFRQADSTSTRSHGGLGVGLAIVRHIVEMHNGTVHAESAGPGAGATFVVCLPRLRTHPSQESSDEAGAANNGTAVSSSASAATLEGLRVLAVDDDPDARVLLEQVIRQHHGDVKVVGSAMEAIDLVGQWLPHVLVSDIAMPEYDGYALIKTFRNSPVEALRKLPAVALTAHAGEKDRAQTLQAGFQAHLTKPVEPTELVSQVRHLVGRKRQVASHQ